jgi:hypothetical protein
VLILHSKHLAELLPYPAPVHQQQTDLFVAAQLAFQERCIFVEKSLTNWCFETLPCGIGCPLNQIEVAGGTVVVGCPEGPEARFEPIEPFFVRVTPEIRIAVV